MERTDFLSAEVLWVVLGLALLIAEFSSPGLVLAFFGLGAILVGLICIFAELSLNWQIAVFLFSSVGMLLSLRSTLSQVFPSLTKDSDSEDAHEVVGEWGTVTARISDHAPGKVEFHGSEWRAAAHEEIPVGTTIEVIGRENLTLLVRAVDVA